MTHATERILGAVDQASDLVEWVCAIARVLGAWAPRDANPAVHTVLHAVSGAIVDDALENGVFPVTLKVAVCDSEIAISVTDGRPAAARSPLRLSPELREARSLTSRWEVRRVASRGSNLTAVIPIPPARRTLRGRLRALIGGTR